jgi:hypothetical protein
VNRQAAVQPAAKAAPGGILQRKCACGKHAAEGQCEDCKEKQQALRRKAAPGAGTASVPPSVHQVLRSPGEPLDSATRAFMEPRFGHDFSQVRVHRDGRAAESARAVSALAYTVGKSVVFADGQYQPATAAGRRLLAHELTHVVQQQGLENSTPLSIASSSDFLERQAEDASMKAAFGIPPSLLTGSRLYSTQLQRTPASKVSCGAGPLNVVDKAPFVVADPVGTITAAEIRANELLDAAIEELEFARGEVLSGKPASWPTIGDSLGEALPIFGLDPENDKVWRKDGVGTAALLLRRLRAVRRTIGAGSFYFTCLGSARGKIGLCEGSICEDANAATCRGSFHINFCPPFWERNAEGQAETLMHESFHNFAGFILHNQRSREGNAYCYVRFVQTAAGASGPQRTDKCPDP